MGLICAVAVPVMALFTLIAIGVPAAQKAGELPPENALTPFADFMRWSLLALIMAAALALVTWLAVVYFKKPKNTSGEEK